MFISHVEGVEGSCYMLDTASCTVHYMEISNVQGVERNKKYIQTNTKGYI